MATTKIESQEDSRAQLPDLEKGEDTDQQQKDSRSAEEEIGRDLGKHLSRSSEKQDQPASETYPLSDLDNDLVGWESQDDPMNPRNFPNKKKWFIMALVTAITFLSPLASSIFAPGIPFVIKDFGSSQLLGSFAVSVYVLGFAFGPLFLSPLSEIYGRCIVLNISNVFFCAFTLGCALSPTMGCLIAMRFLAGVGGSACLTIGMGVIADLFITVQRGTAMSVYIMGILIGPIIGPICGGFVAQHVGWRWDIWIVFILGCVITIALIVFNSETNHAVLLDRKVIALRKELDRHELQSIISKQKSAATLNTLDVIKTSSTRPMKILFRSPIVLFCSLYMSFLFGLNYLLFTTITPVFLSTYNWQPDITGLAYLGIGIGELLGVGIVAKTSDATIIRMMKKNNGVHEPEMRLPLCAFFGSMIPVSFFMYGWLAHYHVHWIVPIIALGIFGIGVIGVLTPLQTYIIDCFPAYAASAIAGMTALRCLFGALLPLAGPGMYKVLGLGWGNSLLGFIAVAFIPIPTLLYRYGKAVRNRWPLNVE